MYIVVISEFSKWFYEEIESRRERHFGRHYRKGISAFKEISWALLLTEEATE